MDRDRFPGEASAPGAAGRTDRNVAARMTRSSYRLVPRVRSLSTAQPASARGLTGLKSWRQLGLAVFFQTEVCFPVGSQPGTSLTSECAPEPLLAMWPLRGLYHTPNLSDFRESPVPLNGTPDEARPIQVAPC